MPSPEPPLPAWLSRLFAGGLQREIAGHESVPFVLGEFAARYLASPLDPALWGLANSLLAELDLEPTDSAIVSLEHLT